MQASTESRSNLKGFFLKTNRTFTGVRKHSWVLVPAVAFGSVYYPVLGLFVFAIMIIIMFTGFFQGRYWCGNLCPHGSLFDRFSMPVSMFKKIPGFFKSPITRWVFFSFYMAMFGVRLARVMPLWGNPEFLGRFGTLMGRQYLVMPTIIGFILSFLNPRVWCSFCPMGTFGQLMYKAGKALKINTKRDKKVTIAAVEKCHKCATCARVCPVQLMLYRNFDENNQFSNELCIRCGTCAENCPADQLWMMNLEEAEHLKRTTSLEGFNKRVSASAVIEKITDLSDKIKEFTFLLKRNNKNPIDFKPGQFVLIKVNTDPEVFRAYSISTVQPDNPQQLTVTVQKVQNGYGSDIVFREFTEGMEVELEGPLGSELIVDKETENILLIGGGIGITPFVPIVKDITDNPGSVKKAVLLYGVNNEGEFLYNDFFSAAEKENSLFKYIKTVAFPGNTWKGNTGFVTEVLKNMDLTGFKIYMCGPPPMVNAVLKILKQMEAEGMGVEEKFIYYESA